jgi:hypothetical protein
VMIIRVVRTASDGIGRGLVGLIQGKEQDDQDPVSPRDVQGDLGGVQGNVILR